MTPEKYDNETLMVLIAFYAAENGTISPVSTQVIGTIIYFTNICSPLFKTQYPYPQKCVALTQDDMAFPSLHQQVDLLSRNGLLERLDCQNESYRITTKGFDFIEQHMVELKQQGELTTVLNLCREVVSSLNGTCTEDIGKLFELDVHRHAGLSSFEPNETGKYGNYITEMVVQFYPPNRPVTACESVHRYINYHKILLVGSQSRPIAQCV
jgi:hypothetical protein